MMHAHEAAILGIIPARGGSKGVLRKNIRDLAGKPLIAYTIEAALRAERLTRVVVSTEDEEIARIASEWGADVPFRRPVELAGDSVRTLPVVQHAIEQMERLDGRTYEVIALLQPTTPLRTSEDIDEGILRLLDSGADTVVSVVDVGGYHPFRMKRLLDDGRVINYVDQGFEDMRPRQELPPVYIRSGALYISRRHVIMSENRLVGRDCRGIVVSPERAVNIDAPYDFMVAEDALRRQQEEAE